MDPHRSEAADAAPRSATPGTLTEWLRRRSDRDLARLLRLRPDLALPAPPDLAALASRIGVRTSTQRCVDALDAFALRTLENLVLAADRDDSVAMPTTVEGIEEAGLATLFERALVWGDEDRIHLVPTVRETVGAYPAGLGRPAAALFAFVPDVQLAPVLRSLGLPPGT